MPPSRNEELPNKGSAPSWVVGEPGLTPVCWADSARRTQGLPKGVCSECSWFWGPETLPCHSSIIHQDRRYFGGQALGRGHRSTRFLVLRRSHSAYSMFPSAEGCSRCLDHLALLPEGSISPNAENAVCWDEGSPIENPITPRNGGPVVKINIQGPHLLSSFECGGL